MSGIVEFFLGNPLFLAPFLLLAAIVIYALLRKLLKIAAIVVIAAVLYCSWPSTSEGVSRHTWWQADTKRWG